MARRFIGGSSDRIEVGTFSVVSTQMTIACWIYLFSFSTSRDDRYISKANGVFAVDHDWMLGMAAPSNVIRARFNRSDDTILGSTALTANTWHHCAVTYNNGSIILYLNGIQDGSGSVNSGNLPNNSNLVYIGNQPTSTSSAPDGLLAEVGLWNVALNASEVRLLSQGLPINLLRANALEGYWPLHGGSPEIDLSRYNRHGILVGTSIRDHPTKVWVYRKWIWYPQPPSGNISDLQVVVSDSIALADGTEVVLGYTKSASDVTALDDSTNLVYGFHSVLADSSILSDSFALLFQYYTNFEDSIALNDAFGVTLSYTLIAGDFYSLADADVELRRSTAILVSDSFELTDSLNYLLDWKVLRNESIELTETTQIDLSLLFSDSLTISDTFTISPVVSVADSLALDDSVRLDYGSIFEDILSFSDSVHSSFNVFTFTFTDSFLLSDKVKVGLPGMVITSAQSGNWSNSSTWVNGVVPGDGNGVIIAAGHTITVDEDTTVGMSNGNVSSGGTAAIVRQGSTGATSGGRLIIAANVTLRIRGDVVDEWTLATVSDDYQLLTMEAGSKLIFDSSTTNPTSTTYRFRVNGNTRPNYRIKCNGTPASWCEISSDPGGGNGWFSNEGGSIRMCGFEVRYTRFIRIGDANNPCINFYPSTGHAGLKLDIEHAHFTSCGFINIVINADSDIIVRLVDVHMRDTLAAYCTNLRFQNAVSTGTRLMKDCTWDKVHGPVAGAPSWRGLNVENTVFIDRPNVALGEYGTWKSVLLRNSSTSSFAFRTALGEKIYVKSDHSTANPHYLACQADTASELRGAVMEGGANATAGDLWLTPATAPSVEKTYICRQLLAIPADDGGSSGVITIFGEGGSNTKVTIEKNTIYQVNSNQCITVSEGSSLPADSIQFIRSNLFAAPDVSDPKPVKTWDQHGLNNPTGIVEDRVPPTGADYNAGWNTRPTWPNSAYTNERKGYAGKFSTTAPNPPGANDLDGEDPGFPDITRRLAVFPTRVMGLSASAWQTSTVYNVGDVVSYSRTGWCNGQTVLYRCIAAHTSGASTEPSLGSNWRSNWIFHAFQAIMDGMRNGQLTLIDSLYNWVRDGWAPTNSVYANSAHDGGVIGAVPMTQPAVNVFDSYVLSDSTTVRADNFFLAADNINLTDSTGLGISLILSDSSTLSDAFDKADDTYTIAKGVGDTIQLSDTIGIGLAYLRLLSDQILLTDTAEVFIALRQELTDTISLTDSTQLSFKYFLLTTDSLAFMDSLSTFPPPGASMHVVDALSFSDTVTTFFSTDDVSYLRRYLNDEG